MKKVIEKYKENLETCKRYATKGDISMISDIWNRKVEKINGILKVLESDSLTPEYFDKLESRDRWDISEGLKDKVHWYCGGCGEEMDTDPEGTFNEVVCSGCEFTLTRRTGGGQSDPFGWTFKYKTKELRRLKLKELSNEN